MENINRSAALTIDQIEIWIRQLPELKEYKHDINTSQSNDMSEKWVTFRYIRSHFCTAHVSCNQASLFVTAALNESISARLPYKHFINTWKQTVRFEII